MATPRRIVTGGSGKVGGAVLQHLVDRGYDVVNVDVKVSEQPVCRCLTADLTDRGQVIDALSTAPDGQPGSVSGSHSLGRHPATAHAPGVKGFRQNLEERAALISNRRAKELLGWKQQFFLL